MRVHVGDEVLVVSHHVGRPPRRGTITAIAGTTTPRFWVQWASGALSLYFPDADCVVLNDAGDHQFVGAPEAPESLSTIVRRPGFAEAWFDEDQDHTEARITLRLRDYELTGFGLAHRNPHDPDLPAVGEELAAARALSDLAHQLLDLAGLQIERHAGHPVDVAL